MSGGKKQAGVRELFLKALELPAEERAGFLRGCGADPEVLREVEELLAHSSPATVLKVGGPAVPPPAAAAAASQAVLDSRLRSLLSFAAPMASTRHRQWVTGLILLALLGVGGHFLRSRIREITQGQALSALQGIAESNASAFRGRVEEWRHAVEAVAASEAGRGRLIAALRQPSPEALAAAKEQAGGLLSAGRFKRYYLADAVGGIRAVGGEGAQERWATPLGLEMFGRAFESGKTTVVIAGPHHAVFQGEAGAAGTPELVFFVPLIDAGTTRAGIFAASRSLSELGSTLQQARMYETGETYIFSTEGAILSPSRFQAQMEKWGLASRSGDGRKAILLRDPGRALEDEPVRAGEDPATWPQTLLLRTVMAAASASADGKSHSGILAQPYRDYRGEPVVSAWRWLPELNAGLTTEVDAREVLEAPRVVDRTLMGLLGALALAGAWSVFTSGLLIRLRNERRRQDELGAYSLIEKIGEGGMGEVFLARHALLQRTAALKLLRRDRLDDSYFAMFENEVRTASRLRHPNTVGIYDFGRAKDGTFYCAMEYLPGRDLAEWVKRKGKMPVGRTIHIVRQICSALSEAHGEGLLHCDVKPSNVMLCAMGGLYDHIKLLDFGLAQQLRQRGGEVSGTPYYTAPERLRADGEVDVRCDIYSLGVLWFYLLTARLPHQMETPWVEATLKGEMSPVTAFADVDAELAELVDSCIARDVERRPASVIELLSRLEGPARRYPWGSQDAREAWQ